MTKTTVTEALASLKTLEKRINKKFDNITPYIYRQEAIRDPLDNQGGSKSYIEKEMQALTDLQEHRLSLRRAIQKSNEKTNVKVAGVSRTIADWLLWRREILPNRQHVLGRIVDAISKARREATQKNWNVSATDSGQYSMDLVINVNEVEIREQIEHLEDINGTLDGLLSLANATTIIEV